MLLTIHSKDIASWGHTLFSQFALLFEFQSKKLQPKNIGLESYFQFCLKTSKNIFLLAGTEFKG